MSPSSTRDLLPLLAWIASAASLATTGYVPLDSGHRLWYKIARPELLEAPRAIEEAPRLAHTTLRL